MRFTLTAASIAAAATMAAGGSLALAASPRAPGKATGGKIGIYVTNTSETKGRITITGAIGDYGTTVSSDANGKVDPNGDYQRIHLQHGGLVVNSSGLEKKLAHLRPQINNTNCSFAAAGTGPVKIVSGTGAYAGAHGSATVTVTFAGIGPKTKSGGCNMSDNAPTYGAFNTVTGHGTVSFR